MLTFRCRCGAAMEGTSAPTTVLRDGTIDVAERWTSPTPTYGCCWSNWRWRLRVRSLFIYLFLHLVACQDSQLNWGEGETNHGLLPARCKLASASQSGKLHTLDLTIEFASWKSDVQMEKLLILNFFRMFVDFIISNLRILLSYCYMPTK